MPSKLALRLAERIKQEFNITVEPIIKRTYAGYWQRAQGAFLWYMFSDTGDIGSCYRATDVVKAKKIEMLAFGEIEVIEQ